MSDGECLESKLILLKVMNNHRYIEWLKIIYIINYSKNRNITLILPYDATVG